MKDEHMKFKATFSWQKHPSTRRHPPPPFFFVRKLDLNLRTRPVKGCMWSVDLCGAETCALRKAGRKCLGSFEMKCGRRIEKISWTYRVRNEMLNGVKDVRNVLGTVIRRKAISVGHILRKNCRLKLVIKGKIEDGIKVTGRRGRRLK
jgi:hypothetical protein